MAVAIAGVVLTACGATGAQPVARVTTPIPTTAASPAPTPAATPTPFSLPTPTPLQNCTIPTPLGVCVGRAATADEQNAMLSAGRSAVETKYHVKPIAQCQDGDSCFIVQSPLIAIVGTNAGVFGGVLGVYPQGGLGCGVLVFLTYDQAGWHYVNSGCVQNPGGVPGTYDHVSVSSGCANFRTEPSLTAKVVGCLPANTEVSVDSAPVFADGHIWWHLAGRGWMAHDFLLAPNL